MNRMGESLKITLLFILLVSQGLNVFSQSAGIVITGTIRDEASNQPIPYATVAALSGTNDMVLNGATTDDNGTFSLEVDDANIYVEISFIGYQKKTIRDLRFTGSKATLNTIYLIAAMQDLDEIQITAERSTVEFKLDKRIYNVGSDISNTGLGALDLLSNVPSVNVDLEGQITLRGNSGVQILINGKPSVLADERSNALGTLTADMIERIEVITNPSAKYEAEGSSGIINIVLKKEDKKSFNGSVSVNTGLPDNHNIGVSLNNRTERFNFFTQFGVGYRSMPTFTKNRNQNLITNTRIESEGTEYRNEFFYNINLGTDYYINDFNVITLSGQFAFEREDQPSDIGFMLWDENGGLSSYYRRIGDTEADNPKYQYDLQYKKEFKKNKDHFLLLSHTGNFFGKDQHSVFTNNLLAGNATDASQRTEADFYQSDYTLLLDYTNPLSDKITLEAGSLYEINDVGNDYAVFNQAGELWVLDSSLTNNFEYNQKVLGIYGTGSYEGTKWGVKLGLRVEHTNLQTLLINTQEKNTMDYTNIFPTLHTSYKMNKRFSLQAGYSKRISRPRLWDLNPFFNIQNQYSVRTGNPDLLPEFADAYELSGIYIFDQLSLNASVYHLFTTDVVESISYVQDNVNIRSPENIGTRAQTGVEINGKYIPADWITLNGDVNYGLFTRSGRFESQDFAFQGEQWTSQLTAKYKLPADIEMEISGNHQSGFKTVQGRISGFIYADAGIRKKLWKGKAIITFSVRDLFASRIQESVARQATFDLYQFSQRGRFFTAGFSYSFGKGEAMTYSGGRRR